MGKVISVVIQKGGTGKTTTVRNLAVVLKQRGCKVLQIDLDPQASLTSLSLEPDNETFSPQYTTLDLLLGREWQPYRLQSGGFDWCDTVVADIGLAQAEQDLLFRPDGFANVLRDEIANAGLREQYDYIIIDGPPSLGVLTTNAIRAADGLIIPTQTEEASLMGLVLLMNTIQHLRPSKRNPLPIIAIQPTQYRGTKLHQHHLERLQEAYGDTVCEPIAVSTKYGESDTMRLPLVIHAPQLAQPWVALADRVEGWANG